MTNYENLKTTVDSLNEDFEKFFVKGNNAAGTRLRKQLQEVKKLANLIRAEVTDKKKAEKAS